MTALAARSRPTTDLERPVPRIGAGSPLALLLPLLLLLASGASAQLKPLDPFAEIPPVEADLVSEVEQVAPGSSFTVALVLRHAPGNHTYYTNPGEVGDPPTIEWDLPAGVTAGPLRFPVPIVGNLGGTNFYCYEGETWFLATMTTAAQIPKTLEIHGDAGWLVCSEQCIRGEARLSLSIATGTETRTDPAIADAFERARARLPLAEAPWTITVSEEGGRIFIDMIPGANAVEEPVAPHFFSSDRQDDAQRPQTVKRLPDGGWRLEVPRATEDALGRPIERLPHISGILYSASGWIAGRPESTGIAISRLPIDRAPTDSPPGAGPPLPVILGLMFLGGLILNLMPCVFPVIGLKIMGFVQQAGEDRRKVIVHGLVFTAGVLVSFWVISGLLFAAREAAATSADVTWGYQLQNPWVVLGLMLLMFVLALNMYGLFEVGTSAVGIGGRLQGGPGLHGSFFSGVLATVVATPCSAPFLGAGIGAAIGLPPIPFFASFTAMAIGLSLPYLVLSIFPQLTRRLPRSGPWMESFRQAMSFLLFATAGFLLWVYVGLEEIGLPRMLDAVIGLTGVAVAVWVYGRWTTPARAVRTRRIAVAVAAAFAIGGVSAMIPREKGLEWETWSRARTEELLADDTPVYIEFTASWCLTCQLNKRRAYTDEVVAMMRKKGIVPLRADNTSRAPEINRAIRSYGRAAVPVNVLLVPGSEPVVTPELLSPDYLLELFEEHIP